MFKKSYTIIFTRAAQDLTSHKNKYILGQAGIRELNIAKNNESN